MVSNAEQIQILFEILLSVDSDSNLYAALKKTLSTVLRKLSCSAGGIYSFPDGNNDDVEPLITIPRNSSRITIFSTAEERIIKLTKEYSSNELRKRLPVFKDSSESGCYHILSLSDFGFIILIKNNGCLLPAFVKSLQPVFNKIGNMFSSMLKRDISRLNEERLRSIYENVNIGLFRVSFTGQMVMLNPAGRRILGLSPEERIDSLNISDFYADPEERIKIINAVNSGEVIKNKQIKWKKKNGEQFPVQVSSTSFKDEFGNITYFEGSFLDITERKNFENNLKVAKDNAERSEKLKSDFLAQMSHEIRTPINTILNFTSLLRSDFETQINEDSGFAFISIENGANRLLRTIDLVLNMSDIENETYKEYFEEIHFEKEILIPVVQEFSTAAERKGLDLKLISQNSQYGLVYADRYTLTQIVVNLLDNAIKYTNKGEIKVMFTKNGDQSAFEICDTGIGIAKEYIPHLFDKFTQEEVGYTRKFEGTGLGLSLVKKYCEINNAEIKVESKKGEGTKFLISLKNRLKEGK